MVGCPEVMLSQVTYVLSYYLLRHFWCVQPLLASVYVVYVLGVRVVFSVVVWLMHVFVVFVFCIVPVHGIGSRHAFGQAIMILNRVGSSGGCSFSPYFLR